MCRLRRQTDVQKLRLLTQLTIYCARIDLKGCLIFLTLRLLTPDITGDSALIVPFLPAVQNYAAPAAKVAGKIHACGITEGREGEPIPEYLKRIVNSTFRPHKMGLESCTPFGLVITHIFESSSGVRA